MNEYTISFPHFPFPTHRAWACGISFMVAFLFVVVLAFGFWGKVIPITGIVISLFILVESIVRILIWRKNRKNFGLRGGICNG